MGHPRLGGAVSRLREWREDDIESVYSVTDDPVIPLISEIPRGQRDRTAALRFITSQHKRLADQQGWGFAVTARDDDEAVGYVGVLWIAKPAGRASIGYWTCPKGRRRGLTTDAVRTVADWVLTRAGAARLEAFIEPCNTGSIRVAEAAGFRREGLMRSFAPLGGIRKDAFLYAKITGDVPASRPPGSGSRK
jgi:[ribosomal protein S5]-alanine N-acetyltransferase